MLNVSNANSRSVGEYIMGVILMCSKRIMEGCRLYSLGKSNKELYRKPFELYGKTIGIVGAGDIARQVMEFSRCFGLDILCWTRNPSAHKDLCGVRFVSLKELCAKADIIVACLPYVEDTKEIINSECIKLMKSTAVFVSVSRSGILDAESLLEKAKEEKSFYVCLDIDVDSTYVNKYEMSDNIIITPHLAGITIESRRRMFINISQNIVNYLSLHKDL